MSVHASLHVICRDDMSRVCFQKRDVNTILSRQTIESLTLEREVGFDTYLCRVVSLSKDTFTPQKVLVYPGSAEAVAHPYMTVKLLTGTLNTNTNKHLRLSASSDV